MKRRRRFDSFIEALVRGRRPRSFKADPEDAEAIRTAIELRAAAPGGAEPGDEFTRSLLARLREQREPLAPMPAEQPAAEVIEMRENRRRYSRRRVLEGLGIAASAAALGGLVDHFVEGGPALQVGAQNQLVPDPGQWVTVASANSVDSDRITPFVTNDVAGFVVNDNGTLRGLSATCTHQGCILRANDAAGRLDCPCHRAAFSLDGTVMFHRFPEPLRPLPTLRVRRAGSDVQVLLPPTQTS